MKKNQRLLTISLTHKPKVLIYGNGFSITANSNGINKKLDAMIRDVCKKNNPSISEQALKELIFPQQVVVATNDHVHEYVKALGNEMKTISLSEDGKTLFSGVKAAEFDAILTPNYTNEMELYSKGKFGTYEYNFTVQKPKEKLYRIKQLLYYYMDLSEEGIDAPVWHIHGNAFASKSMILGQYYYGKLLMEIGNYLPKLMARITIAKNFNKEELDVRSWVDYFLLGDVHIIGFGMDPAELDLWWLAACKKNEFPDTNIFFYDTHKNIDTGKYALMKAYGIKTITPDSFNGDYLAYYLQTLKAISST